MNSFVGRYDHHTTTDGAVVACTSSAPVPFPIEQLRKYYPSAKFYEDVAKTFANMVKTRSLADQAAAIVDRLRLIDESKSWQMLCYCLFEILSTQILWVNRFYPGSVLHDLVSWQPHALNERRRQHQQSDPNRNFLAHPQELFDEQVLKNLLVLNDGESEEFPKVTTLHDYYELEESQPSKNLQVASIIQVVYEHSSQSLPGAPFCGTKRKADEEEDVAVPPAESATTATTNMWDIVAVAAPGGAAPGGAIVNSKVGENVVVNAINGVALISQDSLNADNILFQEAIDQMKDEYIKEVDEFIKEVVHNLVSTAIDNAVPQMGGDGGALNAGMEMELDADAPTSSPHTSAHSAPTQPQLLLPPPPQLLLPPPPQHASNTSDTSDASVNKVSWGTLSIGMQQRLSLPLWDLLNVYDAAEDELNSDTWFGKDCPGAVNSHRFPGRHRPLSRIRFEVDGRHHFEYRDKSGVLTSRKNTWERHRRDAQNADIAATTPADLLAASRAASRIALDAARATREGITGAAADADAELDGADAA